MAAGTDALGFRLGSYQLNKLLFKPADAGVPAGASFLELRSGCDVRRSPYRLEPALHRLGDLGHGPLRGRGVPGAGRLRGDRHAHA